MIDYFGLGNNTFCFCLSMTVVVPRYVEEEKNRN